MAQFIDSLRPGGGSVLRVGGELDLAVVDELIAQVRGCLARADTVELDFEDVTFIDSSCLGALVLVNKEAAAQAKDLALVNVQSSTLRLLEISGLLHSLVKRDEQS